MAVNPFYPLLVLIVTLPLGLSFFSFKEVTLVLAILFVIVSITLLIHIKERFEFLKHPLKFAVLMVSIYIWGKDFSIEKLPLDLFFTAYAFIVFLLLKGKIFRNYFYISLLSFLSLAVVGINFQNVIYGFLIFFYLFNLVYFFLLLAVKAFEFSNHNLFKNLFKYSFVIFVFVLAFGGILFFTLPRPEKPLVTFIRKEIPKPAIGFSNEVKLGAFSEIVGDTTVVFRAKLPFKGNKDLYWRGNTLEVFDGLRWKAVSFVYLKRLSSSRIKPIRELLLISPHGGKNIFTYGYPIKVINSSGDVYINETKGIAETKKAIVKPLKVELFAVNLQNVRVTLLKKELLLHIPPQLKPILERIVKEHRLKGLPFNRLLGRVGKYFSTFRYSLDNKARNLEEFLTVYKEGNCEYFASASALLFRFLGYPTRIVVGFFGGDYNPITGYYVVRQKEAHAWVEIYFNRRWIRFDATKYAQVSEKLKQELQNTLKQNRLHLIWDTVNTLWLEYVINLDRQKQETLFERVKALVQNAASWNSIIILIITSLLVILFVFRNRFVFMLINIYYRFKYRIEIPLSSTPMELYIFLWKRYPLIWKKERDTILKINRYLINTGF